MLSIATSMREFGEQVASRALSTTTSPRSASSGSAGSAWSPPPASPSVGHQVVAVDIDAEKIEALRSGAPLPIHEPGLPELVERNRERLRFTLEMSEALEASRLLFCCVDTPPTYSGDADLSRVEAVVAALPAGAEHALVMKSTVPAGTGEAIRRQNPELVYISCPEFLKEGSAVDDFLHPDRVVIGADPGSEWAADAVADAYAPLGGEIVRTDVASAEMIKLASNAFLATKISFINEIANVCEGVGADVNEVARGMGLDPRIGPQFLQAGIGYGGSCFPKDVSALKMLAGNTGYHFQLLNSVIEVNELQKRRVISKLTKHLGSLVGKRIALLGLAFKPHTDDMREASSLVLSARLQGEGASVGRLRPGRRAAGRAALAQCRALPDAGRRARGSRRGDPGHRVARVRRARLGGARRADGEPVDRGRAQLPRPGADARRGLHLRGDRSPVRRQRRRRLELMRALVLVGGEGTRLRPLTLSQPKPALALVDRPFIRYLVDWVGRHGIDEVIMACGFKADALREALGDEVPGGPSIVYISEPEPLGTAGPLRLAADQGLLDERFVAINGDLLTDLDLTALLRQHEATGAVATLALHPVADPSSYGLVRRREDGEVLGFLEKPDPDEIDTDEVNAGAYVIEPSVIELIPPGRAVSIEREIFPQLVGNGLYGLRLDGYWMDIGTPERYLQASWDILEGRVETELAGTGGPFVAAGAEVSPAASLASRAVVRSGSTVGDGAVVAESVLLDGCRVGADAEVRGSILARRVEVGDGATIAAGSVLGERARVEAGAAVAAGARIAPGEVIEPEVVV